MKRRTMLMLMLLGLGIASFPQVASAQSVEKSKSYGFRVIRSDCGFLATNGSWCGF